MAKEKWASSWLTVLPLKSLGYVLNRQEFRDGINLRYGWSIEKIPAFCACGKRNDVDHTLTCKKGGYVSMRHNSIRDCEANFLRQVCRDVRTEPELLPTRPEYLNQQANSQQNARLDISAIGVWSTFERSFFDVRVTHPNCASNEQTSLVKLYSKHENEKKKFYGERVLQVEKGSFTPLVFTTSGGMGPECTKFNKRLAELISLKTGERYALVMNHIRVRLRFALLRSTLIAVRGIRGKTNFDTEKIDDISFNLIPDANSYEVP